MSIPTIKPYRMPPIASLAVSRVAWAPSPKRCALLIHDMQRYFIDFFPRGAEPACEHRNPAQPLPGARHPGCLLDADGRTEFR